MESAFAGTGVGNRTVQEMCLGAVELLTEVARGAEALGKSTRSNGATLSGSALSEGLLLYWHSQAMAELSALLFWLERNAYARSLTMKQIFDSYGHISMEMMKLVDLVALVLDYADRLGLDLNLGAEMESGFKQARP